MSSSEIKTTILDFIREFSSFGNEVTECFSCGNCYWFSHILMHRFAAFKPTIWYEPILNHFVTEINGSFYDISGDNIPSGAYDPWDEYKYFDPLETNRIIRDCILKEKRKD